MNSNLSTCAECGMAVSPGEYHPFAACLMFKGCHDGDQVRANLDAVRGHVAQPDPAMAGGEISDDEIIETLKGQGFVGKVRALLKRVQPASGEDAAHYLATHGVNIRQAFKAVMDHVCIDQDGDALYWKHEINALDAAMQQEKP